MYRYTVETIQAGQPRPYADTVNHTRVTFERTSWRAGDTTFAPWTALTEDHVRTVLKGLRCGFPTREPEGWWDTKLDWVRETSPGVWEFHTTTAYTD